MTGVTNPMIEVTESGTVSGVTVSSRRNRNGLWPMFSRMKVAEYQATTRAIRNIRASITTIRMPPRWSAVSLATTAPSPVHGEPSRRPLRPRLLSGIARLLEIAGIDFVEARRGKVDADQFDLGGEPPRDLGAQIALA